MRWTVRVVEAEVVQRGRTGRWTAQAIEGDHAFGEWLHLGTSSPTDTDIVTPNNDSPYSYAWVDVRAEPWVLTMPPIEQNRYYVSQWDDLWGFVLDNPGSVTDGNRGVTVLLAGPDFSGELPQGVSRVIKGESEFLGTLTRTQLLGTDNDIERVREIQQQYTLQPLSSFLHQPAPVAAPAVPWPAWTEGDEMTPKFWDYVSFLLPFTSNNPADQKMYDAPITSTARSVCTWESLATWPGRRCITPCRPMPPERRWTPAGQLLGHLPARPTATGHLLLVVHHVRHSRPLAGGQSDRPVTS